MKKALWMMFAVALVSLPVLVAAEVLPTDTTVTTDPAVVDTTAYTDPAVVDTAAYTDPTVYPTNNNNDNNTDPVTYEGASYTTDIKAYGEQTASHSIGDLTVDSHEYGTTNFENFGFSGTLDVMTSTCNGGPCDFGVIQGDFSVSKDWGSTYADTWIDVKNYTGSVDMSSYGGMAVCTTADPAAYGSFYQTQHIDQTVNGPLGSTSVYSGTQTLNLKSLQP